MSAQAPPAQNEREDPVAVLLSQRYPSHHRLLETVWSWNREATSESLECALRLGGELGERYPHVLAARYEHALSLVKLKRRDEAIGELERALREFTVVDEDTLCLLARCHKDRGDGALKAGAFSESQRNYQTSIDYYQRAYDLAHDRFPGINVAALRLILAGVLARQQDEGRVSQATTIEDLCLSSREMASKLLRTREKWPAKLPDDNIWLLATEAEARLLLREWSAAAELYKASSQERNCQTFHVESMRAQAERIIRAFAALEVKVGNEMANLDAVF